MTTAIAEKPVTKVAKAPVAKAPVAKAPVAKAPVAKAPVAKAPVKTVAEKPVSEAPVKTVAKRGRPAFLIDPVIVAFQVSSETKDLLQKTAKANGEKLSDVLRKALESYLSTL